MVGSLRGLARTMAGHGIHLVELAMSMALGHVSRHRTGADVGVLT
jgi:hypothetical protein